MRAAQATSWAMAAGVYLLRMPFGRPAHSLFGTEKPSVGTLQPISDRCSSMLRAKQLPMVKTVAPAAMRKLRRGSGRTSGVSRASASGHFASGFLASRTSRAGVADIGALLAIGQRPAQAVEELGYFSAPPGASAGGA